MSSKRLAKAMNIAAIAISVTAIIINIIIEIRLCRIRKTLEQAEQTYAERGE